jgi:hypothetical protein
MKIKERGISFVLVGTMALFLATYSYTGFAASCVNGSGEVVDEAMCVGRTAESFPAADEDYFRDMDY